MEYKRKIIHNKDLPYSIGNGIQCLVEKNLKKIQLYVHDRITLLYTEIIWINYNSMPINNHFQNK